MNLFPSTKGNIPINNLESDIKIQESWLDPKYGLDRGEALPFPNERAVPKGS